MARGTDWTKVKTQNSRLCSGAILLLNKSCAMKYFLALGCKNCFVYSVLKLEGFFLITDFFFFFFNMGFYYVAKTGVQWLYTGTIVVHCGL